MDELLVRIDQLLMRISEVVWGPIMICLLVGTGLYLTIRLGFVQFRHLGHSIRCISGKYDKPEDSGDISHFRALTTALSATIGTGNIAGVATAIAMGGPGAVFWMWMTALVGMATKFTSCSLALHFRDIHEDDSASGGPMYFLKKGFHPAWLVSLAGQQNTRKMAIALAAAFALFTIIASFGIGNMVQANSVVNGLSYILPQAWQQSEMGFGACQVNSFNFIIGLILAILVALVILGGIRRIAGVTARLVPFMCVIYVLGSITVLIFNIAKIPACLAMIFRYAFSGYAVGGGIVGATVAQAMRFGVARGVFSNESGLGSAPMAHAAAKTKEMAREGFVAMLGPFIDTIVICSMTALVILVTDVRNSGLTSSSLTAKAFDVGLFGYGQYIVGFGLIFFAYSTTISWSYYGDRCAEYLFGQRAIKWYRYIYIMLIVVGAIGGLRIIWNLADIFNALMALPNLIGLVALVGLVVAKKRDYLRRLKTGEFD
ncbi:MAG: alanine/glycine:cation symporter family protein [Planctomycetota bacterium]|jgi:AGCS family alanine or glycine:cation symporter